jgi:hypothetical protein
MEQNTLIVETRNLINQKDRLEHELRQLMAVLEQVSKRFTYGYHTNTSSPICNIKNRVGLQDDLLDADKFPRADLDHITIRTARHQIAGRKKGR